MKNPLETQDKSRLWAWLLISFLIHCVILSILFVRFGQMQFKKGTSTNPQMKVAGFQILGGGELESKQDTHNQLAAPKFSSTPPTPKQTQNAKTQSNTNELDLSSLSLYDGRGKHQQTTRQRSRVKALAKFPGVDEVTRRDIEELYGAEFGDYGIAEQEFLVNNLRDIGRITKKYLEYPASAIRLGQEGLSAVEFYLHPNGDISGLKIIVSSNYMLLDRNSERTIEIAYKDYPRPITKTKIRIFVTYGIYYYGH